MKKLLFLVPALLTALCLASCGVQEDGPSTLVYGSGDYTRINPDMDEHGEINILLFNGLTAHDGETGWRRAWRKNGRLMRIPVPTPFIWRKA